MAGRIPGALQPLQHGQPRADGTFKPPAELKREFQAVLGDRAPAEVVHYCGSGVAACHNLLAMEIAGLPGSQALCRARGASGRPTRSARAKKAKA